MLKKNIFTISAFLTLFIWPPPVFAAENLQCNTGGKKGINTAIGCIPVNDLSDFAGFFLKWFLGIGGGIALIFIIYSSFLIITSSGDPKKVQAGKELLTAALTGLILMIFSIFILRFVGVDLLKVLK
jgi:hypothetical protein